MRFKGENDKAPASVKKQDWSQVSRKVWRPVTRLLPRTKLEVMLAPLSVRSSVSYLTARTGRSEGVIHWMRGRNQGEQGRERLYPVEGLEMKISWNREHVQWLRLGAGGRGGGEKHFLFLTNILHYSQNMNVSVSV